MDDTVRDLLVHGIASAKAGEAQQATFYLEWLLRLDPSLEFRKEAWYWLSRVSTDPKVKRAYIEEILANDLWDARARRELAILDGKLKPDQIIDPDRAVQPVPGGPQAAAGQRFTCPTCGGRMTYTPDGQSLTCEYCASKQSLGQTGRKGGVTENEFIVGMATGAGHFRPVTIHEITCRGCGATFLLNPEQLSRTCPYCQSAYVLDNPSTREVAAPDGLIPFQVDEQQARQALVEWFNSRSFEQRPRVARGYGLYAPAWCFDIGGTLLVRCEIQTGRREWQDYTDQQVIQVQNLLISAAKSVPEGWQALVDSYDLSALVPYDERYLANWLAETYQVSMSDASLKARELAYGHKKIEISEHIEYHYRDLNCSSAGMLIESYRLVLLPVWMSRFSDGNREYPLWINGQTGVVFSTYE